MKRMIKAARSGRNYPNKNVKEILNKMSSVGVDTTSKEAIDYAEGAADLIYLGPDTYTVDEWWRDTKMNYMDEIDELPHTR